MDTLSEFDDKGRFSNFTRSIVESLSSLSPNFDKFRANLRMSQNQLNSFGGNKIANFFRSFTASLDLSNSKIGKFSSIVMHPVSSLKSLGTALSTASATAGGSGSIMHGALLKMKTGFKGMASTGIASIKSLSAAMLSNPITAVLLLITAAIVGAVAAWKSNFMNVQGVVKSFASGIAKSITSLKEQFSGAKPVIDLFVNILKGSFKYALAGAVGAVALLVDAFRAIVTAGLSVVKTALAVGNGIKGLWAKIKGDSDGADKAFNDMKQNLVDIKDGFDNFADNSAMKAATNSMKEFGNESEKTKAVLVSNLSEADKKVRNLSDSFNQTGQSMVDAFDMEGRTDSIVRYFETANDTVKQYQTKREELIYQSNQIIEKAQDKSEEEKRKAYIKSSELIIWLSID